jgi:hypothetical protein
MKKYRETHKEKLNETSKKWYEDHKEQSNKRSKNYHETHREDIKEKKKKYYKDNKDKLIEWSKKYYESNKELAIKFKKYQRYFYKKYYRYITLKNYVTICKLGDESLKRSIMTKLGCGTIDQDEAILLSGMTFTEDDEKEMNEWWNICKYKSSLWRKDLYIHNH